MIRELGLLTGGMAVFGLLRSQYEKNHLTIEETDILSDKIKQDRTVVFLSDLHDKEFGKDNLDLLAAIERIHPDAVLIGGDMIVGGKSAEKEFAVIRNLLCGLADRYRVFYGNGNHEQYLRWKRCDHKGGYRKLCKLLKDAGVVHLSDRSALLGDDIRIDGLNIDRSYYRRFKPSRFDSSYVSQHLGKADEAKFQILLAHSPIFFDAYAEWGADLSLTGHFHGGTIRLPFFGGVMTPQLHFFHPWCGGDFEQNGKRMIVSRGLGTHTINIRINDKPQIVVLHLKQKK